MTIDNNLTLSPFALKYAIFNPIESDLMILEYQVAGQSLFPKVCKRGDAIALMLCTSRITYKYNHLNLRRESVYCTINLIKVSYLLLPA